MLSDGEVDVQEDESSWKLSSLDHSPISFVEFDKIEIELSN